MRSLSIVKFYVIIDTFCELLLGFVLCAIDFFSLHEREKRLHDSIVMERPGAEKDWTTLFMCNSLQKVLVQYCIFCLTWRLVSQRTMWTPAIVMIYNSTPHLNFALDVITFRLCWCVAI